VSVRRGGKCGLPSFHPSCPPALWDVRLMATHVFTRLENQRPVERVIRSHTRSM
jgi:hypothetical protein